MKLTNRNRSTRNDQLFLFGYYILILNQVLSQSQYGELQAGSVLFKSIRIVLLVLFGFLIILKGKLPINKSGYLWLIFLGIAVIEMLYDKKIFVLILIFTVLASYKVNIRRIIKVHIEAIISGLLFVIFSCVIGIISDRAVEKELDNFSGFLGRTTNVRYAFGFTNSNIVPIALLFLYLYFVIYNEKKHRVYYDIVFLILAFIAYMLCGSRVCVLLSLLAVFLRMMLSKDSERFIKIGSVFCTISLPTFIAGTIIISSTQIYYHPIVRKLDVLLTARITIMRNVITLFPLRLFGYGDIPKTVDNKLLYLDNGYLSILITLGIVTGIMFFAILILIVKQATKQKNPYIILFLIILLLDNIIDSSILHHYSFPIFIISFNQAVRSYETHFNRLNKNHLIRFNRLMINSKEHGR